MTTTNTGKRTFSPVSVETEDGTMMYFYGHGGAVVGEDGKYREVPGCHLGPRTKATNPYSYDPLLQWRKYNETPTNASAVYSDRMSQWNYAKYRELMEKHFAGIGNDRGGDYFGSRGASRIEAFLRDYFDKQDLELVRIEEHCNQATGYPVWAFFYVDPSYTPPAPREDSSAA